MSSNELEACNSHAPLDDTRIPTSSPLLAMPPELWTEIRGHLFIHSPANERQKTEIQLSRLNRQFRLIFGDGKVASVASFVRAKELSNAIRHAGRTVPTELTLNYEGFEDGGGEYFEELLELCGEKLREVTLVAGHNPVMLGESLNQSRGTDWYGEGVLLALGRMDQLEELKIMGKRGYGFSIPVVAADWLVSTLPNLRRLDVSVKLERGMQSDLEASFSKRLESLEYTPMGPEASIAQARGRKLVVPFHTLELESWNDSSPDHRNFLSRFSEFQFGGYLFVDKGGLNLFNELSAPRITSFSSIAGPDQLPFVETWVNLRRWEIHFSFFRDSHKRVLDVLKLLQNLSELAVMGRPGPKGPKEADVLGE
ncbi:hypothetical protein T439DRAFT_351086 [Meredithblackwellia eburnea MCA 4105]